MKKWWFDALWLIGLALYILSGYRLVPFHGDEATMIYMSRDYHYLVQERDLDRVLYREPPLDPAEQALRILNGTVSKMGYGLAWDLAGLTVNDLNDQWLWGVAWDWNLRDGHMPSDRLLWAARLSSALMLVVSAWALFAIARLIVPDRVAAYVATAIYATTPVVLLNGRRVMYEGALVCFALLTVLAAVLLVREQGNPGKQRRRSALWSILLGILSGFAIASKHTALITVGAAWAAVMLHPLIWPGAGSLRARLLGYNRRRILRFVVIVVLAGLAFLALTPAWWSEPLSMPNRVRMARATMLEGQVSLFGGYDNWGERVASLIDAAFFARPQYYEVAEWRGDIDGQIRAYDGQWYAGRGGGPVWGGLLVALFAAGMIYAVPRWREPGMWLALVWLALTAAALLISVPLEWQRYYIPLQAPLAVIAGAGAVWVKRLASPPSSLSTAWRGGVRTG